MDAKPNADPKSSKIIIVDDDARLRDLLRRYLTQEGFMVLVAEDAAALSKIAQRESVNLIVLDWMLPGEDGLAICKRLRDNGDKTPIIMLTAKGEEYSRIEGLESGADDYLAKPFNPRELLARIHAVLRRQPAAELPAGPDQEGGQLTFGDHVLDVGLRQLYKLVDGQKQILPLTSGEFAMLKTLARHPRQPLTREKLARLARGRAFTAEDRSLDVQVSRLRKLVEDDPKQPRHIQSVWGVGYVFIPD